MDDHAVDVLVRTVHVLAGMVLVGGGLAVAIAGWSARTAGPDRGLLSIASRFEVAYWIAFGAVVSTGLGNLSALGERLPPPESEWGRTFTLKLVLVILLLVFSAVRVLAVLRLRDGGAGYPPTSLGHWYGVTSALSGAIAFAAVWLVHA